MAFSWPGLKPQQRQEHIRAVDVVPTVLRLMDIDPVAGTASTARATASRRGADTTQEVERHDGDPRETLAALQDHVIDRRRFLAFTGALAGHGVVRPGARRRRARGAAAGLSVPARDRLGRPASPTAGRCGRGSRPSRYRGRRHAAARRRRCAGSWRAIARFRRVERRGVVAAVPELAHSVHVDVRGLDPDREYFYRFTTGDEVSPVGRTRTAPRPGARVRTLTFAFASCQAWPDGYYSAYRRMAEEDLDLVVHLGDYIYEYGIPADGGVAQRRRAGGAARELRDARPLPAAARALQDATPTCRSAPPLPLGRDLGRPRGGERLRRASTRGRARPRPEFVAKPGRGLPGVLRAHAAAPLGAARRTGDAAALPAAALRRPRRVQRARHAPVPHRPAVRRRRAAALRGRASTPTRR